MQVAILGRQPKISLAELESLFGAEKIQQVSTYAALVDFGEPLPQQRLGGTIKSAKLLTRLENTGLEGAFAHLGISIPHHLTHLPEGKLQFGVSVYGFKAQKNWLLRQMLELKKIIKKNGRSVRIIENKFESLETAQILYNKLTGPLGWELLIIKDGADVILAQTYAVQDIDAYAARDFERPMRDARVGMLPPKLAQIIINLAVRDLQLATNDRPITILDPFCGTGVILQESLLMGLNALGSDLDPRMCDYTTKNLLWLQEEMPLKDLDWEVFPAQDATQAQWKEFSFVASETYLGEPYSTQPNPKTLEENITTVDKLHEKFLLNIARQTKPGFRMSIAVPAWKTPSGFKHLKTLEKLRDLGYNRLEFAHAGSNDLIYHRENQIVGRELVVLERT